jgi:hypothetical protein
MQLWIANFGVSDRRFRFKPAIRRVVGIGEARGLIERVIDPDPEIADRAFRALYVQAEAEPL